MKKRMSKVLSGLIILTMIISSTGLVFADENALDAQVTKTDNSGVEIGLQKELRSAVTSSMKSQFDKKGQFDSKKATAGNDIKVPTWKTGTESELKNLVNANGSLIQYNRTDDNLGYNKCGYSQKVKLNKGTVMIVSIADGDGVNYQPCSYFGIFSDPQMTQPVDSTMYDKKDYGEQEPTLGVFEIPSTGYYYIGAYSSFYSDDAQNYQVYFAALGINGENRTLTSGSQVAVGQKNAQTNYFTFKATKTGYIRILTDTAVKFRLYNSSKTKSLSDTSTSTTDIVYGVKKDTTYQVRVDALYNKNGGYALKLTNSGITESSGSSKSKAKTIYRGSSKAKKGIIIAGSSTADWYKFKLTQKNTIKVTLEGATNNGIKLYVYKGSKLVDSYTLKKSYKSIYIKSYSKMSTGTYYIKIARANSYSSGWYKCYWNYK